MSETDMAGIIDRRADRPQDLIELLLDVQEKDGYISEDTMRQASDQLDVPLTEVYRVVNFYKAFTLKPRGRHVITVCMGTACHVRGARRMLDEVAGRLGVSPGETTEDGEFTVEAVNCLGACALGPVVVLDGAYHDHMTPGKLNELIQSVRDQGMGVDTDE